MKIARFFHNGQERCGVVDGESISEVDWGLRDALVLAASGHDELVDTGLGTTYDTASVSLLAPLVNGSRIFCIGINYPEHQRESADVFSGDIPSHPIVFMKTATAIAAPGTELLLDHAVSREYDWEAELGVLIGAPANAIDRDNAWDVVAGYTLVNDITARDLQVAHVQWFLGKNSQGSTPIGPWVVTRGEMGTHPDVNIRLTVNGITKQDGQTGEMIFDIPTLISTISTVTPLLPGDIIATGTPSGVGFKRTPPEFLTDGDEVEVAVTGVGTLRNRISTGL